MKDIYKAYGVYFRKVRACTGRFYGMYEWEPVKKVWFLFIKDRTRTNIILDDFGFEKVT